MLNVEGQLGVCGNGRTLAMEMPFRARHLHGCVIWKEISLEPDRVNFWLWPSPVDDTSNH